MPHSTGGNYKSRPGHTNPKEMPKGMPKGMPMRVMPPPLTNAPAKKSAKGGRR